MKILVSGLNSYLGKASLQYLQDDSHEVIGLVRDAKLLKSKLKGELNATLEEVDLLIKDFNYSSFSIQCLDLAIYFTQIPDRNDLVGGQVELLSLRNFVQLCKKNQCNRILYVGRFYDKRYMLEVQSLMNELDVDYTIVMKDLGIGEGSSYSQFMEMMIDHKFIFVYKPYGEIHFSPVVLEDVIKWIKMVDWKHRFIRDYVEFGGEKMYSMSEVMALYMKKYASNKKHIIVPIKNRYLANSLNKVFYHIDYEAYSDYIEEASLRPMIDNASWNKMFDFKYTPILDKI